MIYSVRGGRKSERLRVGLRVWLCRRRIRDVGGRYGFSGVRESDNWVEVCGSKVRWGHRTQIELKQWRKLTGAEVYGSVTLVWLWMELGLAWRRRWSSLSLSRGEWSQLSLEKVCDVCECVWGVCEKCKTIEGKIRTEMVLRVRRGFF